MKIIASNPNRNLRRRIGSTLVELMVASSVALLTMGALMALTIQMAREQQYGLADGAVQSQAGTVQDQLAAQLHSMSVNESALFADAVSGKAGCYRRIIVAKGHSSSYPREEIFFNSTNLNLVYDPNRNVANNETILYKPDNFVTLRDLYFYPSLKTGNMPDSSTLNVVMQFDDNGFSSRKDANGARKKMSIYRYFTVKFRNG